MTDYCLYSQNYTQEYFDKNCTVQTQEHGDMSALEPCNYASNVAFYVMTNEICKETWNMPADYGMKIIISYTTRCVRFYYISYGWLRV